MSQLAALIKIQSGTQVSIDGVPHKLGSWGWNAEQAPRNLELELVPIGAGGKVIKLVITTEVPVLDVASASIHQLAQAVIDNS